MKCPKCGYNSFEHLSACKKCNADLTSHKDSHGIRPVILPSLPSRQAAVSPATAVPEDGTDDMFSWDIADGPAEQPEPVTFGSFVAPAVEPPADTGDISFSFDDLPDSTFTTGSRQSAAPVQTAQVGNGDEVASFAGMLETIDREAPATVTPEEFSFDGLEGFEAVDIFAEDSAQMKEPDDHTPPGSDELDALFSAEETRKNGVA